MPCHKDTLLMLHASFPGMLAIHCREMQGLPASLLFGLCWHTAITGSAVLSLCTCTPFTSVHTVLVLGTLGSQL
jgi:hypothetical protein